jgi:hypothetical protein
VFFWWLYMCVLMGGMSTLVSHGLHFRLSNATLNETQPGRPPLNATTLAFVVSGVHLALFGSLVRIAWRAGDRLGAVAIVLTMVILIVVAFFRLRGKTGAAAIAATRVHFGVCWLAILLAFNLRIDVWVAAAYGVSVAEANQLQPIWIVPVLTVVLVAWTYVCMGRFQRSAKLKAGS